MLTVKEIYERWYYQTGPVHLTLDEVEQIAECVFLPLNPNLGDDQNARRAWLNQWRDRALGGTATLLGHPVVVDEVCKR